MRLIAPTFLILGFVATSAAQASCGAGVCSARSGWGVLNINDAQNPGTLLDLRFEAIDLEQLREGSGKLSDAAAHHDELYTRNRNLIATLDHAFTPQWAATLVLPWYERKHAHIHHHGGAEIFDTWDLSGVGDVRLLARHQRPGRHPHSTFAGNLGLKLPTGQYDEANPSGDVAERSLQLGTGTTDAIATVYCGRAFIERNIDFFGQLGAQYPLNDRDDYRPGERWTLDLGMRYGITLKLDALAQLNMLWIGRDAGAEAEADSTGGRYVFFNPGLSLNIDRSWQTYALLQLPLYQYVNGVQLTPDYGFVAGISHRFR